MTPKYIICRMQIISINAMLNERGGQMELDTLCSMIELVKNLELVCFWQSFFDR